MPTKYKNDSDQESNIDKHYSDRFDDIAKHETNKDFDDIAKHETNKDFDDIAKNNPDLAKLGKSGEIANKEAKAESSSNSTDDDNKKENSFYNRTITEKALKKGFIKGVFKDKKTGAGFIAAIVMSILIFAMFAIFSSAPLKWVHFTEWLQDVNFGDMDTVSSQRLSNFVNYARSPFLGTEGLEKTRLGYYGTKQAAKWETRLKANGLTNNYSGGRFTGVSFDASLIEDKSKFNDLKDLQGDDLKKALAKKLNIDPSKITGSGTSFKIEAEDVKFNRRLITSTIDSISSDLPFGRAISRMKARFLILKANMGLNPLTRLVNDSKLSLAEKISKWYDARRERFTGKVDVTMTKKLSETNEREPTTQFERDLLDAKARANTILGDSLSSVRAKLPALKAGASASAIPLIVLAVMCGTIDTTQAVTTQNYTNKINALTAASDEGLGLGAKIQAGEDPNTGEYLIDGDVIAEYDKMYGQYQASTAYRYANGEKIKSTPVLEKEEYAAFAPRPDSFFDRADSLINWIFETFPNYNFGKTLFCGALNLVDGAVSELSNALTLGLSGRIEEWFSQWLINALASDMPDPTDPAFHNTPLGGELAVVGTRVAANETCHAQGCRPLSFDEAEAMKSNRITYEQQNDTRNFAQKMFDFKDINSPISKIYANMGSNIAVHGKAGVLNYMASSFTNIFSRDAEATSEQDVAYYYGIPKSGFNTDILKLAFVEDPYENANWIAENLSLDDEAVKRFETCTKMKVNPDWSFSVLPYPEGIVNYSELPEYCLTDSDVNLYRLRVLALDTANIQGYMCVYEKDQEACEDIYGGTATTEQPVNGGTATNCDVNSNTIYWPVENVNSYTINNNHDIPVPEGTPVYAIKSGKVTNTEQITTSYGNHIQIDHGIDRGIVTYAHLSKIEISEGATVAAGQLIGYSGWSGNVLPPGPQGAHLHVDFNFSESETVIPWLRENNAANPPCASAEPTATKSQQNALSTNLKALIFTDSLSKKT